MSVDFNIFNILTSAAETWFRGSGYLEPISFQELQEECIGGTCVQSILQIPTLCGSTSLPSFACPPRFAIQFCCFKSWLPSWNVPKAPELKKLHSAVLAILIPFLEFSTFYAPTPGIPRRSAAGAYYVPLEADSGKWRQSSGDAVVHWRGPRGCFIAPPHSLHRTCCF